jgi:hypothetical protein
MPFIRSSQIVYRVFQRRTAPGLCCAVPQAMPIPSFVRLDAWNFGRTLGEDESAPTGFQRVPAREASAAFGYYLFHDPCEALAPRHRRIGGHAHLRLRA